MAQSATESGITAATTYIVQFWNSDVAIENGYTDESRVFVLGSGVQLTYNALRDCESGEDIAYFEGGCWRVYFREGERKYADFSDVSISAGS